MKFMLRLARFLAMLALVAATLGICVVYLAVPATGNPGLLFLSAVAVMLAVMAGTLGLLLSLILYARRHTPSPFSAALMSLVALSLAGGFLVAG